METDSNINRNFNLCFFSQYDNNNARYSFVPSISTSSEFSQIDCLCVPVVCPGAYQKGKDDSVYKELEASFHANVEHNFEPRRFGARFAVCILPKLHDFLVQHHPSHRSRTQVLRYSHRHAGTAKQRICTVEQLTVHKGIILNNYNFTSTSL